MNSMTTPMAGDMTPGGEAGEPDRLVGLRLLIVEDDRVFRTALREILRARGVKVLEAENYEAGLRMGLRDCPDFVIADLRLPDGRGDDLCRELRRRGFSRPVAILTGDGEVDTQISGLESGADEFWTKPVPVRLIELRMRAILRRSATATASLPDLRLNGITFDFRSRRATRDGEEVMVNAREFGILEALWKARGAPVSRSDLLARVWDYDHVPNSRTVDNYVVTLRKKLEPDPAEPRFLKTVNGVGYQLLVEGESVPGAEQGEASRGEAGEAAGAGMTGDGPS
jgi:DNA-binding response OmpR family regulator